MGIFYCSRPAPVKHSFVFLIISFNILVSRARASERPVKDFPRAGNGGVCNALQGAPFWTTRIEASARRSGTVGTWDTWDIEISESVLQKRTALVSAKAQGQVPCSALRRSYSDVSRRISSMRSRAR